jgi:hypothetical protein
MDRETVSEKKEQDINKSQMKAGFGQGAFFAGKRKNNSAEGAAKCCSGGTCK